MEIRYANAKIKNICMKEDRARKAFGAKTAQDLYRRLRMLQAAESLESLNTRTFRLHALKGDKKDCLAIDLDKKNRLVIKPIIEEQEKLCVASSVTAPANYPLIRIIEIQFIGDYHR